MTEHSALTTEQNRIHISNCSPLSVVRVTIVERCALTLLSLYVVTSLLARLCRCRVRSAVASSPRRSLGLGRVDKSSLETVPKINTTVNLLNSHGFTITCNQDYAAQAGQLQVTIIAQSDHMGHGQKRVVGHARRIDVRLTGWHHTWNCTYDISFAESNLKNGSSSETDPTL